MSNLFLVDKNLVDEAVLLACNDGMLVKKFKDNELQIDEIARLVSYATLRNLHQRNFDTLFYGAQLDALIDNLKSHSVFSENYEETRYNKSSL